MEIGFVSLYVSDLEISMRFYQRILNIEPIKFAKDFSIFLQDSGSRLVIIARPDFSANSNALSGRFELGISVSTKFEVDSLHKEWREFVRFVHAPTEVLHTYSFLALDPDGHQLRIFTPIGFDN